MKSYAMPNPKSTRLLTALLAAAGAAVTLVQAAAPALNGQAVLRPLTPQEVKDYTLTGAQGASGLSAVGLGQPAYLEALVNSAVPAADITNVTFTLSAKPLGSSANIGTSPLGANVPPYKMADRLNTRVAGRAVLVPDVVGQYAVLANIATASSGSTNITVRISGATYTGINTCALCHSGGIVADDIYHTWATTPHATCFSRAVDGLDTDHFSQRCISCHAVGYDANTNAVNGGFDDIATLLGWTFPPVLTNGNYAAMPAALKNVANVQCESCHGPGSEHAAALGNTNLVNWPRIGVTYSAGDCAQCHDSKNHHYRSAEWNNSGHAIATRTPSGPTRNNCVRCHTAGGFVGFLDHQGMPGTYVTNTVYEAITCQACHDPHDAQHPHQLRTGTQVTLNCGVTVTNAGSGAICLNCHQSRTGSVTNSIEKYPLGLATWANGSSFGPHDTPCADLLLGINGWTYGKEIPSAAHRTVVANACVGCHAQTVAETDPAFTKAGGHTFKLSYTNETGTVHLVGACVECHGEIESFDLAKNDYDGDGVIDGVQTEVQHLLDRLNTLLPDSTYRSNGVYVADGLVNSVSVKTNWPSRFLKGAWNYQLVNNDLSLGIHNAPYAVGLLKASIADLTGDANNDGLPDEWQIKYFGSTTSPNAARNATPAGDGIPNWVKFSMGVDPTVAGVVMPDGVVWTGKIAAGGTTSDGLRIYTAAEVAFDTEVGKTYQIQAASSVTVAWENVGAPIPGTGKEVRYVTPTRDGLSRFFRVVTQ
jgi:hypothetical protein